MVHDGRALAKARERIFQNRQNSENDLLSRREAALTCAPELANVETAIKKLMTNVALDALERDGDINLAVKKAQGETTILREKIAAILRQNGFPENQLEERFSCDSCQDTGYVLGKMCSCLNSAYRDEQSKLLSSMLNLGDQSFASFKLELYEPGNTGLTKAEVQLNMQNVFELCRKYAMDFGKDSRSLIFRGGAGLGKTFLSAAIAKVVSDKGYSVVYDTCVSILEAFESNKFERGTAESGDAALHVKRYLGCDLLILDDLGTELSTAFTQSALYTLINTRMLTGGKTIISTNLSPEELERRYSTQIYSRLRGEYLALSFCGRDIRQVKLDRGL